MDLVMICHLSARETVFPLICAQLPHFPLVMLLVLLLSGLSSRKSIGKIRSVILD